MRHCCVIGGGGFIGSHVVGILCESGRAVTVIGRSPTASRVLPEQVRYVSGDYGDRAFLATALSGVDEVIDLAYSTVPKTSFEDPVNDILSNLPSAVNLFETAVRLRVSKVVMVSSGGTVYGRAIRTPISEDHPTNPISPYGLTKLATDKYAMMFHELRALPVLCVRPGNAFGEGQRSFAGQGFVATAIASVLRRQAIDIFGDTGTVRDYVYVGDIAHGIVAALERGMTGSFYNIGSGVGRTNMAILDAIRPLAASAGLEIRVRHLPLRPFDVPVSILDSSKLRRETGWQVAVPFAEGIARTWKWLSQYPSGET